MLVTFFNFSRCQLLLYSGYKAWGDTSHKLQSQYIHVSLGCPQRVSLLFICFGPKLAIHGDHFDLNVVYIKFSGLKWKSLGMRCEIVV